MFLPCVLAVSSLLVTTCLGSSLEVELDRTKCMLRQTYRVDKMGVFFTWRGVRLENCNIRFARDVTQSEAICVNVLILNISKGHCPPDIEMLPGSSGPSFQLSDCDTYPKRKCMTSEYVSLRLEANASLSVLSVRISTDTSDQKHQPIDEHTDPVLPSGLPLMAIIGIMIGVFIPVIIVVIIVAVICIRRTNKPSGDDTVYQPAKQECTTEMANGSTDIDPSMPLNSVPPDEYDVSQEISQSMRLSAVV